MCECVCVCVCVLIFFSYMDVKMWFVEYHRTLVTFMIFFCNIRFWINDNGYSVMDIQINNFLISFKSAINYDIKQAFYAYSCQKQKTLIHFNHQIAPKIKKKSRNSHSTINKALFQFMHLKKGLRESVFIQKLHLIRKFSV